jgi:hypothetical protein
MQSTSSPRCQQHLASHLHQHFDAHQVRVLSSLAARHGCSILDASAGDVRVRVCSPGDTACDVIVSEQSSRCYKASVLQMHPGMHQDSVSAPAAGSSAALVELLRLHATVPVRAVVILSRCAAQQSVQLVPPLPLTSQPFFCVVLMWSTGTQLRCVYFTSCGRVH